MILQVEELTKQIMTKTLHNPITALKKYPEKKNKGRGKKISIRERKRIIEELFDQKNEK